MEGKDSQGMTCELHSTVPERGERRPYGRGTGVAPPSVVSQTPLPRLDGFEAAYLLRVISAATRRGLPLSGAVAGAADLRGLRQIRRLIPRLGDAGEAGALDEIVGALERGRDAGAAAMLRAARAAGMPAQAVRTVASWCSEWGAERERMARTVSYPITLAVAGTLVFALSFHAVIGPLLVGQFAGLFGEIGTRLPLPTRAMLGLYSLPLKALASPLGTVVWLALVTLAGIGVVRLASRLPDSAAALYVPVLPRIVRYRSALAFCRTLAVLLESRTPLPEALPVAVAAVPNPRIRRGLSGLEATVASGGSLGEALRGARVLPGSVAWRLWSAYFRSDLVPELERCALACKQELEARQGRTQLLMDAVGWVFAILVGIPIGLLVVAMYMPMFNLISKIG